MSRFTVNNDPRLIKVRYACKCKKCNTPLPKGINAYYWPSSREVLCLGCGAAPFHEFLSSVADEAVYNGTGNPYAR